MSLVALSYHFLKTQSLSSPELSLHHLVTHEWFDLEFAYRTLLLADQSLSLELIALSCLDSPKLFIITLSYSLYYDPESFMAFQALSSQSEVVCILHIPEMFCFHHSSHLRVASTQHHEPESILIGNPFRALSSRPKVVPFIYDPESFLAFRALSSRSRVVLLSFMTQSHS